MFLLILYLCIALFISFLCSILEAALLSISPSYVSIIQETKPGIARDLQNFKDNIDRPLASILTLNTFAHTIGAAGVGAQAQKIWGEEYLTAVSIVLTVLILIFTEIIPKTLGANYWRALTPFTVKVLNVLVVMLFPFVYVSQFITKRLNQDKEKSVLSRADFTAMAEIGTKEGVLEKTESNVINNILRFNEIQARHIMTPRTVMRSAPEAQTIKDLYENKTILRHSRIPVFIDSVDQISGFVLKDEILAHIIDGEGEKCLKDIKRDIEIFPETMPIPDLFNTLVEEREQIGLIVDEYGGTSGILTVEDIVETLLGMEITDELDDVVDFQKLAIDKWKQRAKKLGYPEELENPEIKQVIKKDNQNE